MPKQNVFLQNIRESTLIGNSFSERAVRDWLSRLDKDARECQKPSSKRQTCQMEQKYLSLEEQKRGQNF
jgi:hypothetical protein